MVMPTNEMASCSRMRTCVDVLDFDGVGATGNYDLFTIAGGSIYVEMFIGRLQQVITVGGGVVSFYHRFTPLNLAAGIEDLNTILVVTADPLDTIYTCTGDITGILVASEDGLCLTPSFATNHWILTPGTIHLNVTDGGGGSDIDTIIEHTLVYIPLSDNVTVVAQS